MFPKAFATARLNLRPVAMDDAPSIFQAYGQDPEVTRYLTWRPHVSIDDARRYVALCLAAERSRTYMIVLPTTNEVIGAFDLRSPNPFKLEYGYVLARAHWGQGLMSEVLGKLVDWALLQPFVWRIGGIVDVDNLGSIRVMEKAGLQREGVLRKWLIHPNIDDVPRDCLVFSKTQER